ncbi:hypothetical protein [Agromyces sp. CF514]|uniref:hypothetical protein n=1 Tax=Agromyces sp. CF514 TaxID=1881031 RepID=UPI00116082FC|nr:hypothetical protein [Agromyces sp. CF514]
MLSAESAGATSSVVAVVGTLAGALITAIFAVVVAMVSARSQRRSLQAQLAHASLEAIRDARRVVYAEYLDCFDRWIDLREDVRAFATQRILRHRDGAEVEAHAIDAQRDALRTIEQGLRDEWARSTARLSLVSSADVLVAARELFNWSMAEIQQAWALGHTMPTSNEVQSARSAVYELMRRDIGVLDGERTYRSPMFDLPDADADD